MARGKSQSAQATETGKPEPTKAEKSVALAEKRMTKALAALKGVRRLSNRNSYEFTDKQVEQMLTELSNEVKAIAADFEAGKPSGDTGFKLSS